MKKYIISYSYKSKTNNWIWQYIWEANNVYEAIEYTKELSKEFSRNNGEEPIENPVVVTSVYSEDAWIESEFTKYRIMLFIMILFFSVSTNISNTVEGLAINALMMLYCSYYLYKS